MRAATLADVELLRDIERAADERFREIGRDLVADGEPAPYETVAAAVGRGRAWVEVGDAGAPVAYALADVLDGRAFLEQLSVLPEHGRQGIGAALVDVVAGWALAGGHAELTLTTFADVPWNAPYYRRLGFEVVPEARWSAGLRERHVAESAYFRPWPRIVMARPLR
ncbi:GNAT family N-acetyltransferase [Mumia sp. zg.B53]|uniref:GNAT family N-acetyltransferase n=1 Tax=unclassified Mumia TaxID=2621872 RepID=UPI001C6E8C69|nr:MULTISPECIES: GNAT family N-acetyltransferase [unclassified Mumia]MBW9211263.1 GNAT family N-acetyltransferase [Mumia sp. zg.B21]MBW9215838.1 GNAT family N-acetyltransferase [Mumia sp. zg.B53]